MRIPRWLDWLSDLNKRELDDLGYWWGSAVYVRALYPAWERAHPEKAYYLKKVFYPPDQILFELHFTAGKILEKRLRNEVK